MYICVKCRREMHCHKNGVGADFGHGHVYAGDEFRCPICGYIVLATNHAPGYDPKYQFQRKYIIMRQPGDDQENTNDQEHTDEPL